MAEEPRRARRVLPRWGKALMAVGAPVGFLALLELALLAVGYQPKAPPALYDTLPRHKPAGTVRICVVGGSAAAGYPFAPRAGPAPFLRQLLADVAPGQPVEVFNCAVNALTSEGVAHVVRRVLAFEPDVLIVYSGHNEFFNIPALNCVVAAWEPVRPKWFRRTRVVALLGDMALLLRGGPPEEPGPKRTRAERALAAQLGSPPDYEPGMLVPAFEARLRQMVALARPRGAAVVLSTLASNLLAMPPTKPVHRAGLGEGELGAWREHYAEGRAAAKAGRWEQAVRAFRKAARLDPDHAGLLYELGRAHHALGHYPQAAELLAKARDGDRMPMRATTPRNQAVRRVAGEPGACLADAEACLADASPHGIAGDELLCDHVHLTLRGALELARCWARTLERRGLLGPRAGWDWSRARAQEHYERALGLEPAYVARSHVEIGVHCARLEAGGRRVALLRRPQLVEAARALGSRHLAAALRLCPPVVEELLDEFEPYTHCYVAHAYVLARQPDRAVGVCRKTLDAAPGLALAYRVLASAHRARGDPAAAAEAARKLAELERAGSDGGAATQGRGVQEESP